MFHFTTQTHGLTVIVVGGYIIRILLKDVFRKNDVTSFLKRRSKGLIIIKTELITELCRCVLFLRSARSCVFSLCLHGMLSST